MRDPRDMARYPVQSAQERSGLVLHIHVGQHTVGYALLLIATVTAFLAFFLLPLFTAPFFGSTISLSAWQSVTFTNPLTGQGPHSIVDVLTSHYGPLLFSLALFGFACLIGLALVIYDEPGRDWVLHLLAGFVGALALGGAIIIVVVLWPFGIPVDALQFIGGGYWVLFLTAFLAVISGVLIVVP